MKKIIIIAAALIGIGFLGMFVGLALNNWNISVFGFYEDSSYYQEVFTSDEVIERVEVHLKARNVYFYSNDEEVFRVEYYDTEQKEVTINAKEETLYIDEDYENRIFCWRFYYGLKRTVNVYLPVGFSGTVIADNKTGSINITNVAVLEKLETRVTTGSLKIADIHLKTFTSFITSTGNVDINNIQAPSLNIETTTGRLSLKNAIIDGALSLNVRTGSVTVMNLKADSFMAQTTTGSIHAFGIVCGETDLSASTGNIKLYLKGSEEDFTITTTTNTGVISYQGKKQGRQLNILRGSKAVKVSTSTGSINITIEE